ncbi:MAG: prolipoprotein diacylglyceryl transferase [Treponema sp.]|nr:prolipoprotein diacylglyceryl transferase [Treponema sp.]
MNFSPLFLNYPSWIKPEIFPGVPGLSMLRWYGLMYIFAFGTAFIVLRRQKKEGALDTADYKATDDDLFSFIFCGIVFLLLGARIFSTLVYSSYNPEDPSSVDYVHKPWLIFWPFDSEGKFTGLAGMSYHGGFIGGLIGMIVWCLRKKKPLWKWIDAMCVAIPLGYTFGRLGNFLNGELYGRVTSMPWGIMFPTAEHLDYHNEWVQEMAEACGVMVKAGERFVNLPRHPSQLYEAFFEGLFVWGVLWLLRKKKPFDGFLGAMYTILYGCVRFVIEYFRNPDSGANLGYRIGPDSKSGAAELYRNTSLLNISTGQILCFGMITGGLVLMFVLWRLSKRKTNIKQ